MKSGEKVLQTILRLPGTVFTFNELLLLNPGLDVPALQARLTYYVKQGYLYRIRRGLYAKDKQYNKYEVATKIFTPAYISFETVLRHEGMIFQYYTAVYVASYRSETIECDGQEYVFRKVKDILLTNTAGVKVQDTFSIASAERAFLDMLYIHKDYYFDNLNPLDWDKVFEILSIYGGNKRMKKVVTEQYNNYKQS